MLRPATMAKLTIVAPKGKLRPIVDRLHRLNTVHLVEFSEGRAGYEGFRIGKPLPEGQHASDRLVRLRSVGRHLELGEHQPATRYRRADVERSLDEHLHQLELNITSAADAKARVQQTVEGLEKERDLITPLAALPLRLEDYTGYHSLAGFTGRAEASVEGPVREAVPPAEVFVAPSHHFAVFVPKAHAAKAAEVLARSGAQLTEAPKGSGPVQERIDEIGRELDQLRGRLDAATQELQRLRQQHADFLVAAEEHLSIEADKAEAPLGFATTEHAFVAECWVPEAEVPAVQAALREAAGDAVHVEVTRPEAHGHHAHEAPAQSGEAAEAHAGAEHEDTSAIPPTKFNLSRPFRPFQMFTEMVSVPKYDEIDPTPILGLVLPLFLGFMIGDAGYGILMLALGIWMIRSLAGAIPEAKDIGIALAAAGVVSLFFGAVIFTDAFGIPFAMHGEGTEVVTAAACASFMEHAKEVTWSCITGSDAVNAMHPVVAKLRDIGDLLILSVIAAFVHMGLGLVFGIVNSVSHANWKHVIGKLGWAVLMVGFFAQIMYMAGPALNDPATLAVEGNRIAHAVYPPLGIGSPIPIIGVDFHPLLLGGMIAAAVLLAVGEGPITVLELPTMLSNLMSYTRLAGLAIAKGAMAAAFTSLTLVAMVYGNDGGALGLVLVVIGLVLFVLTQAFVFVLGVFSSAIQAIRLNYVEFFQKFYAGGGIPFTPFGKQRKYTQEA